MPACANCKSSTVNTPNIGNWTTGNIMARRTEWHRLTALHQLSVIRIVTIHPGIALGHQLPIYVCSINIYSPYNTSVAVSCYLDHTRLLSKGQIRTHLLCPGAERLFPFGGVDVG